MKKEYPSNARANESVSKFKLLSSYGGPGSLMHTEYGSIMVSCIEEWGFIRKIEEFIATANKTNQKYPITYVQELMEAHGLCLSGDTRLLESLRKDKQLENLDFLVLLPDIELNEQYRTIMGNKVDFAIASTYMPKGFFDFKRNFKTYQEWYRRWPLDEGYFSPPRYVYNGLKVSPKSTRNTALLRQDNIVMICNQGHISDFPWSKYLRWKNESPGDQYKEVDLFNLQNCCSDPQIQISDTNASATGFDGKFIKCNTLGCQFGRGTSLKGIMGLKLSCPGHRPWLADTGAAGNYYGNKRSRESDPPVEPCADPLGNRKVKISLTTGNDLYYSKTLSSLFMPGPLFRDPREQRLITLEKAKNEAVEAEDYPLAATINSEVKMIREELALVDAPEMPPAEREERYRFQEYLALSTREVNEINILDPDLQVGEVTENLKAGLRPYFDRILRIDNLKLTTAQLGFSRVEPMDADAVGVVSQNIYRNAPDQVRAYPVVQNYGEGIFFSFNHALIEAFRPDLLRFERLVRQERIPFAQPAQHLAVQKQHPLYLIHTFSHLVMRELEFRCGYPTASLSERLYVSAANSENKMYGCLIYTCEGEEGSMGGLIAQTLKDNLNGLLSSALYRATVCNSDPLCWESEGQGLFELNLASCFSCSLVSETSCEQRNLYLDRRMLIDEKFGFFKDYDPRP